MSESGADQFKKRIERIKLRRLRHYGLGSASYSLREPDENGYNFLSRAAIAKGYKEVVDAIRKEGLQTV